VTSTQALARAGLIVSAAFLVSRVLGWVRVVVIGNLFPVGSEFTAFVAAFRLPDLMFQLVAAGALSSAVIPIVSALLVTDETARAWRVVSTIANMMLAGLLVLGIVVLIAAPTIIQAINPGFGPDLVNRTVDLTRIMVLSPIFLSLGSLVSSVLNARGRFAASAIAPIVYNLAIIGAAFALTPIFGIAGLAIGVVAGSLGHLLVQLAPLRTQGFRYDARIELDDPEARKALKLMAPRALGLGAGQVTFVVLGSIASTLGTDAPGVFYIAFTLLQIPIGVIGVPLGVVVLPSLSREAGTGNLDEFAALMSRAIRLILFVMLPITGISIVLSREIVAVLFSYSPAAIERTASTLVAFLLGLTAHALIAILARAFYARHDTRTPVAAAILAVLINSTLAGVLVGPFDLPGLALAIAIAAWVEAIVLLVLLRRSLPELAFRPLLSLGLRSLAVAVGGAAAAAGVLAGLTLATGIDPSRLELIVRIVVVGFVWLLSSAIAASVLRIAELRAIIGIMFDLLRRPRRA
jgi:putative peptidoglycan lipid II flippase